jgi:hypothetical protein
MLLGVFSLLLLLIIASPSMAFNQGEVLEGEELMKRANEPGRRICPMKTNYDTWSYDNGMFVKRSAKLWEETDKKGKKVKRKLDVVHIKQDEKGNDNEVYLLDPKTEESIMLTSFASYHRQKGEEKGKFYLTGSFNAAFVCDGGMT